MWQDLLGPEWILGVLAVAGALGCFASAVAVILTTLAAGNPSDPVLETWRRNKPGSLTEPKVQRLTRRMPQTGTGARRG